MEKTKDIGTNILATCDTLLVIEDNIVRFQHVPISRYLPDRSKCMPLQVAQCDLATICMAYNNGFFQAEHCGRAIPQTPPPWILYEILDSAFPSFSWL